MEFSYVGMAFWIGRFLLHAGIAIVQNCTDRWHPRAETIGEKPRALAGGGHFCMLQDVGLAGAVDGLGG